MPGDVESSTAPAFGRSFLWSSGEQSDLPEVRGEHQSDQNRAPRKACLDFRFCFAFSFSPVAVIASLLAVREPCTEPLIHISNRRIAVRTFRSSQARKPSRRTGLICSRNARRFNFRIAHQWFSTQCSNLMS